MNLKDQVHQTRQDERLSTFWNILLKESAIAFKYGLSPLSMNLTGDIEEAIKQGTIPEDAPDVVEWRKLRSKHEELETTFYIMANNRWPTDSL